MTGRRPPDEFDGLRQDLSLLAEDAVFPPTPEFRLDFPVRASSEEMSVRRLNRTLPPLWTMGLAAAVVLVVLTLAIPVTRDSAGSWFGLPGIRIEFGDREDDPPQTVTSIGGSLLLGEATTLGDAATQSGFPVMVPKGSLAESVPEVYLNRFRDAPVVSLLYPATDDLPSIGTTGVGVLLMQIDASGNTSIMIVKRATGENPPQPVTVNGNPGYWIQGGVLMADAGDPFWTYQRRSGNVLTWEQDGVTYRMESNLPMEDALAIAESLAPHIP